MPLPGGGSGVGGGPYTPYPPASQMGGGSVYPPPYPPMSGGYPYPGYQQSGVASGYPPNQGGSGMYPPAYPPATQPVSFYFWIRLFCSDHSATSFAKNTKPKKGSNG